MKIKKTLLISSSIIPLGFFPIVLSTSCSSNNAINKENKEMEKAKKELNDFLATPDWQTFLQSKPVKTINKPTDASFKKTNLFSILHDSSLVSSVFKVETENLVTPLKQIFISFDYGQEVDSYNNFMEPTLNSNQNAIVVPALITYTKEVSKEDKEEEKKEYITIQKYVELFTLKIQNNVLVNNSDDPEYNGTLGKAIEFQEIQFQAVPDLIIDKYLELNAFFKSPESKKEVVYVQPETTEEKNKWIDKTFNEVKNQSNTILSPTSFQYGPSSKFIYKIDSSSTFDQNEQEYPRFINTIEPDFQNNNSLKTIGETTYKLSFTKKYTYVDRRYKFKLPNQSEIDSFVSKNNQIATDIATASNNSTILNSPIINIPLWELKKETVDSLIKRFHNARDFSPSESYTYNVIGDDNRKISFKIIGLEKEETNENYLKINQEVLVGEGKLQGKATITKTLNIKTGEFVIVTPTY